MFQGEITEMRDDLDTRARAIVQHAASIPELPGWLRTQCNAWLAEWEEYEYALKIELGE
jgi:hypothetical protein